MTVQPNVNALVVSGGQQISLGSVFGVTGDSDPAYVVLNLLDRNEYTAGATGATGTVSGNGHTLSLTSEGSDARGIGLAFAYQATTGRYYNATYGYLDQLTYTASGSLNDVTDLTLYAAGSQALATAYAASSYGLMQNAAFTPLGTVAVATQPGFAAPANNATPGAIVAAAQSFVGRAWNMEGCWVLASTIAADAGASLPVTSTAIGLPGTANGEWITAFNGPRGASGDWQSMVHAGEVVVFGTPGGGHVTTCVAGAGASATLIDNITYENAAGQVVNGANDGSAADVLVAPAHAASQEWSGVSASSVVIYELDTPTVTDLAPTVSLRAGASDAFTSLFSVTDPARGVTEIQAYDANTADRLTVNGTAAQANSAASAVTAASLAALGFVAGSAAGTDTLEVRAYNGSYWGDWQALGVTVSAAPAPAPAPPPPPQVVTAPILAAQTANLAVTEGQAIALTLNPGTFHDPQGQALTVSATLSDGQALPSWLHFDAAHDVFSGTAPLTPQSIGIRVTATDTSGLSASEVFQVSVTAPPPAPPSAPPAPAKPVLLTQMLGQDFGTAHTVAFAMPTGTFAGSALRFEAFEVSGPNITGWMRFNGATGAFSGVVPAGFSGTAQVEIVAFNNVGYATDTFAMHFGAAMTGGQTAMQPTVGAIASFH